MTITYQINAAVEPGQLRRLFEQTTWARGRDDDAIGKMLERTALHASAWDGRELVGFARSVTDTVFRALIDDVVVDAPYRGQGIGTELVRTLDGLLRHVDEVFLGCTDAEVAFYERLGFARASHPCLKKTNKSH
jgi:GNAT superfamily N-acetyltransferase